MDDNVYEEENLNFITCAVWIPRGVAKANPEKVEVSKEDLARLINETKVDVDELEEDEKDKGDEVEDDGAMDVDGEGITDSDGKQAKDSDVDGEGVTDKENKPAKDNDKPHVSRKNDDGLDFEELYHMEKYEDGDAAESMKKLYHLGRMTIHASCDDDPLVTVKDKDDLDSEDEDHAILPSDNLIAVGHVEGDAAILEVYVYNAEQECLYVHHDILLPAVPLSMEWLNYDPTDEELKPGNLVAIGSMSPIIEVWDLDLIDCLEPAYKLGKKAKKKKQIKGVGHKDAVLSLAWNNYAEHVLASGSADETVILWDLQHGTVAQQMSCFKEKVQSIKWHPTEPHSLLTGACDKTVRLFDCNDSESFKSWKLDGEVECVLWDKHSSQPHKFMASTDKGTVYGIDSRQEKPMWSIDAHSDGCTGLQMSSQCPGCLVTVSVDETLKVWDIANDEPKLIKSSDTKIGVMHCLSSCQDKPFVFCIGGDKKSNNFKVLDIRHSKRVRTTFCPRIGLPADENEADSDNEEFSSENFFANKKFNEDRAKVVLLDDNSETDMGAKPKEKFRKRNSGFVEKRHKRWS